MDIDKREALAARIVRMQENLGMGPIAMEIGCEHDGRTPHGYICVFSAPPLAGTWIREYVRKLNSEGETLVIQESVNGIVIL